MTQSTSPTRTAGPHRTFFFGAGHADVALTPAVGARTGRRPRVLSRNEAVFPDRALFGSRYEIRE